MATLFRAVVMLTVLVGLPSAWVYYGPLPPEAMGMVERTIASARASLGWSSPSGDDPWQSDPWRNDATQTAPRFDARQLDVPPSGSTPAATVAELRPRLQTAPQRSAIRDSQFQLASASVPVAQSPMIPPPLAQSPPVAKPAEPLALSAAVTAKLQPHLSLLQKLGAEEYTLENWGGAGQLYRFRCAIVWGGSQNFTRQFEAVAADAERAVHQVVGEVTAWQNAGAATQSRRLR